MTSFPHPFLFVALDGAVEYQAEQVARACWALDPRGGLCDRVGFKLNIGAFMNDGIRLIRRLQIRYPHRLLYVDLKLYDSAEIMCDVFQELDAWGVSCVSAYLLADMHLERALAGWDRKQLHVVGITVLTHMNDAYCYEHFYNELSESVLHFALRARSIGCDYVQIPPHLGSRVNVRLPHVSSAIRPQWFRDTRLQHHVTLTPAQACEAGVSVLVCGRPITEVRNTQEALRSILSEMGVL